MSFWRVLEVLGTAAALVLLVTAAVVEPDPHGRGTATELGLPACPVLTETGHPCLTCGMTTAFSHMAHLQPAAAMAANPGGVLLFLVVLAAPFWLLHALFTGKDPLRFVRHPVWGWLLPLVLAVTLATWMLRGI